jgi:DNA gyrase subunit A
MMHTTAHAYMLFFTNQGKVYQLRAHEIPVGSRNSRGTAIVNLLQLDPDERVMAVIDTRDYETVRYLLFVTAGGIVKKTAFSAYSNIRQNGLRAVNLREGDELVRVVPISGDFDVCLVTSDGQLMRFNPEEAREMGRVASGVKGVKLKSESASVVSCAAARDDHELLVVTTNGLGKRTAFDAFGAKHRGGMGMRVMKLRDEGAEIVRAMAVLPDDEVMLIASNGVIIRTPVSEISLQGRDASGVRVMSVPDGERVVAVTLVREPEGDDDEDGEGSSEDGAAAETSADATEASTDDVAEDAATNEEAGDEEE